MPALPPGTYATAPVIPARTQRVRNTGVAFLTLLASRAPASPVQCFSLDDFTAAVGDRQTYSTGYDWADTFFHEGGQVLWVMPAVGPAVATAFLDLAGTTGTTLRVNAKDRGDYANGATGGLSVQVAAGSTGGLYTLIVFWNGVEVERATDLLDDQAAVAWSAGSSYVTITKQAGTGDPVVLARTSLAGGSTDRTNVTDTQWQAALDALPTDLGPGQVAAPDWATDTGRTALLAHAAARNRFALCDPAAGASKATLLTTAAAVRGTVNGSDGALVAPWVTIPGLAAGSSGRKAPASALAAAKMAETDASESPNQAAAGRWGVARFATGVETSFSRDTVNAINDAGDLNAAGVNLMIVKDDEVKVFGNRTLVDPAGPERGNLQVSNMRYRMWTIDRVKTIGSRHEFERINRAVLDALEVEVSAMLLADYIEGDLFGDLTNDVPATAYRVDTLTVNTPQTMQAGQMNVKVNARPSKGAELVNFTINLLPLTAAV